MPLSDLTDPEAVRQAVAEYDRIGQDAFLSKYGFGPSREYYLVLGGRTYDSKAIVGAAYGYQFPSLGPMPASAFSGGAATVQRKLLDLGFDVVVEDQEATVVRRNEGYWVFVCNPARWAIDRFFQMRIERDTWGVRHSDGPAFAPGHLALIRVGVDRRTRAELAGGQRLQAGIYAICSVESSAYPGLGANDDFWADGEQKAEGWPTVDIRYVKTYAGNPLTIARLRQEVPTVSSLLLNGFQASSFPISREDFEAVVMLLGDDIADLPCAEVSAVSTLDRLAELESRYIGAAPTVREYVSRCVERGPIGGLVKSANGHRCQICHELGLNPIGFLKSDGTPYVEAHHVTPVSSGMIGSLGAANVVTLCANHHRQLHFGGVEIGFDESHFTFNLPTGSVRIPRFKADAKR
jgi:hypothetical protein